jgi:hypothetical protein
MKTQNLIIVILCVLVGGLGYLVLNPKSSQSPQAFNPNQPNFPTLPNPQTINPLPSTAPTPTTSIDTGNQPANPSPPSNVVTFNTQQSGTTPNSTPEITYTTLQGNIVGFKVKVGGKTYTKDEISNNLRQKFGERIKNNLYGQACVDSNATADQKKAGCIKVAWGFDCAIGDEGACNALNLVLNYKEGDTYRINLDNAMKNECTRNPSSIACKASLDGKLFS